MEEADLSFDGLLMMMMMMILVGSAEWHYLIQNPRRWTGCGVWLKRRRQPYDTRLDVLRIREILLVTGKLHFA